MSRRDADNEFLWEITQFLLLNSINAHIQTKVSIYPDFNVLTTAFRIYFGLWEMPEGGEPINYDDDDDNNYDNDDGEDDNNDDDDDDAKFI